MSSVLHFRLVVSLIIVAYLCDLGVSLYNGDNCLFKDGSMGTCKLLTDCKEAFDKILKGIVPENICGFEGPQSIVCCRDDESGPSRTTNTFTTTTTTTYAPDVTVTKKYQAEVAVSNRRPGDISREKCKQYAQYAYERKPTPVLLIKSQISNTLECAFEKLKLIVGGTPASRQEFPHMALIGYGTSDIQWSCGGSLISENFVLTAAHCLKSQQLGPATFVRFGIINKQDTDNLQERKVVELIPYPEYISKYHDIGLLRLSESVNLNTYVRPACLQTEKNIPSKKCVASGWGKIDYAGPLSNELLRAVLEFFSVGQCNATYAKKILETRSSIPYGIDDDLMVCAGSSEDIKDSCEGDSGGPLQIYHNDSDGLKCMYDIVGVTSFGMICGIRKGVPGIYTRVSTYITWIEDIVWPQ